MTDNENGWALSPFSGIPIFLYIDDNNKKNNPEHNKAMSSSKTHLFFKK
jgi:hypothetical protein